MPELPEVETVRTAACAVLVGRRIEKAVILDPRLVRPFDPELVAAELVGERVAAVERRGKYLVVRFESDRVLLIHLRMTGSLRHATTGALADDPHRRAVLSLDNRLGRRLPRRAPLRHLGAARAWRAPPVPCSAPRARAAQRSHRSASGRATGRAPNVAEGGAPRPANSGGAGEHLCGRSPVVRAPAPIAAGGRARGGRGVRLLRGVRRALRLGIERQGASLRDYATPDGERGAMQEEFRAYGREGEPCDRCGAPIMKTRVAGRGTWYCPRCQA